MGAHWCSVTIVGVAPARDQHRKCGLLLQEVPVTDWPVLYRSTSQSKVVSVHSSVETDVHGVHGFTV